MRFLMAMTAPASSDIIRSDDAPSVDRALVPEMPRAREYHGDIVFVGGFDHLVVADRAAGNIGGGGFMVVHLADRNQDIAIDYRETAPGATTRDIFLGADGKPDNAKSRDSALGIGVPGTVAGLALALEKYGSGHFTLAQLLKPSIELARDGFV